MTSLLSQGLEHQKANRFAKAATIFRDILKKEPKHPDAMHFLGLALWNTTQQSKEPLELIRRSMKLAPNMPHMHHNIASVLSSVDEINEAVDHYKRALELKPDYAEAYFNLSGVYKFQSGDPLIGQMQTLYARNNLKGLEQEFLVFALSKAMNDTAQYHEAFHFALEAAHLKKLNYKTGPLENSLAETRKFLNAKNMKRRNNVKGQEGGQDGGQETDAPIFIVGMARSGTTLTETILSRHSDVFAAGELPMIGSINAQMRQFAKTQLGFEGNFSGYLPLMPANHFTDAGASCLKFVKERAGGQDFVRFTDKMPQNVFHLGLIAKMFPNARIIHIKRHPLDTCVSCFFQRFRFGHEYSYQLDWLGHYYRQYALTMRHWKRVLDLPILEMRYEDLVTDPQGQSKKLVEFAGLEWNKDCLNPQDSSRNVLTASRWQVRQPIYTSSLDRWKRYEPYLQPLVDALGGWGWIEKQLMR